MGLFPSRSPRVLSQSGAENAGAIDIGDGLAVVFKVESHNHPSAVEPLQGAATGVGGIVRDVLAMGARPIALLNSLRFGPLDDARNRHLLRGVWSRAYPGTATASASRTWAARFTSTIPTRKTRWSTPCA